MDFKTKRQTPVGHRTKQAGILVNPSFVQWFGKSKVANTDGSPKVVHHGTNHKFSSFNTEHGAWFTSDKDLTSDYGTEKTLHVFYQFRTRISAATEKTSNWAQEPLLKRPDA